MNKTFIKIIAYFFGIDYYNRVSKNILKSFDKTVNELNQLDAVLMEEQEKRRIALENIQLELNQLQQDREKNERIREKIKYLIE